MIRIWVLILLLVVGCSQDKSQDSAPKSEVPKIEGAEWKISSIEVGELDFGLVDFNQNKLLTVNILNDTAQTIIGSPTLNNENFTIAYSSCLDLKPREKCILKMSFNAQSKSENSYTANLTYGEAINTVTAQISRDGQVLDSLFKSSGVAITQYDFGTIEYRHNLIKTIIVSNTGLEPITSSAVVTGSGFRKVYDKCSNIPLKYNKSCVVKVLLSGQGLVGDITGELSYAGKSLSFLAKVKTQDQLAQENSEFIFVYNGQNNASTPIDLQTINVNENKIYNFYIKNIGTSPGQVNSFSLDSFFNVLLNSCEGQIIAPNKTCFLKAAIVPQLKGTFSTNMVADVDYQVNSQSVQWTVRAPGDKIECTNEIPHALLANITWNGNAYSACTLESCLENYHIDDNACSENVVSCSVPNGSGTQTWNSQSGVYENCLVNACESNRYTIVNNACDYIEPVAQNASHNLLEDGSVLNQSLNFSTTNPATITVVSSVTNGVLTRNGSSYSYTPNANFHGVDFFTYKINDGQVDSNVATVSFTITAVNDAPVASSQEVVTPEDTLKNITLVGTDIDGDALNYIIVTQPTNGLLVQTGNLVVYTPNLNFFGSDSFTFKVNDGQVDSAPVTVSITVSPVNDAPIALAQTLGIVEDTARSFTLSGTDVEGSALSYTVTQMPTTGTLSGTAPNFTYTPTFDFANDVTMKFKVNDGSLDSQEVVITFTRNLITRTYINERIAALETKYVNKGKNITLPRVTQEPVTVANINAVSSVINNLNLTETTSTLISGSNLTAADINTAFAKHNNIRLHCVNISECYANKNIYNKAIYIASILTVKNNLLWEAANARYLGTQCEAWYSESEVSWADKKLDSNKTNFVNGTYADNTTNNRYLTVYQNTAPTCGTVYYSYYQGCRPYGYTYITLGSTRYPAADMGNGGCASGSGVATVSKGDNMHIGSHYYGSSTLRSGY